MRELKSERITARITPEVKKMCKKLCEDMNKSQSDIISLAIMNLMSEY